jgi:hypothetical protein
MIDKNQEIELDLTKRDGIKESVLKTMAQNSLRTIALAYKDISMKEYRSILRKIDEDAYIV